MPEKDFKDKIITLLPKISFFGGVSAEDVNYFIERLEEKRCSAGEIIYNEGGKPGDLYIILEGEILFSMDGKGLEAMTAGGLFGMSSTIGIQKQLFTTTAVGEVTLAVIPKKVLYRLEKEKLNLFSKIILNIARDLARALNLLKGVLSEKKG